MAFSPTPSAALRYWNMARQRYCRRLARYRHTLRVSADPAAKPAARFDGRETPRALASAAGLARSAERARLWLSLIRIQRPTHVRPGKAPTPVGTGVAFSPTPSAALRYWSLARQRYYRRLARYRNTLRVSTDPAAKSAPHPARKSGGSRLSKPDARERRTLRWREMDSNF